MRVHTRSLCGAFFAMSMSSCVANSQQLETRELQTYAHSGEFIMPKGIKNPQARAFFDIAQKWMNDRPVHVVPGPYGGITLENEPRCKRLLELFQQREDSAHQEDYAILEPLEASTDTEHVFSSIQADRPDIPLNRMYSFATKYDFPSPELKHVDCGRSCPNVETVADWSALYRLEDWEEKGQDSWLIYNEIECQGRTDRYWCPGSEYYGAGYWAYLGADWKEFKRFFSFRENQNRLHVVGSSASKEPLSQDSGFPIFGESLPVVLFGDIHIFSVRVRRNTNTFLRQLIENKQDRTQQALPVSVIAELRIARLRQSESSMESICRFDFYTVDLD